MKLIIYLIVLLGISNSVNAQLKYEGSINSDYKTITLDDGTVKYIVYSAKEKKVDLYDMDHSIWKTIQLPLPKHHFLSEIKHVSVHTFNSDDHVELIYSCTVLTSDDIEFTPEDEYRKIDFTINMVNDQGELLLSVPNSNDIKIKERTLLIYRHSSNRIGQGDETLVYSF